MLRTLAALAASCFVSTAEAALVLTDDDNLVSLTVLQSLSTAEGFVTLTFRIEPIGASDEITSIDADFSAGSLRQVNPFGFSSIFTDANGAFASEGEAIDSDSQFLFDSGDVIVASSAESAMRLDASFTGFSGITSDTPVVQLVAPANTTVSFDLLEFGVREVGVPGVPRIADFTGLSVVAIPEPSVFGVGALLTLGALLRRRDRR